MQMSEYICTEDHGGNFLICCHPQKLSTLQTTFRGMQRVEACKIAMPGLKSRGPLVNFFIVKRFPTIQASILS
jgi:hypothetical protein